MQALSSQARVVQHQAGRRNVVAIRCQSTASTTPGAPTDSPVNPFVMSAVNALFQNKTIFGMAQKQAKNLIRKRAEKIGIDWQGTMQEFKGQDWQAMMKAVENPNLVYPDYYTKPFHAYEQGNMCWEAAHEVTMAAKSVHALVFSTDNKTVDPEGDAKMRVSFNTRTKECMQELGADASKVQDVVDLGCSAGLSSVALLSAFPGSSVTGIDLSPQFITMAKYDQQKREAVSGPERLTFIHGLAEDTQLPAASYDLVSMCLVCHELPQSASKAIFREAFRLLKPGGCLSVMEMDPDQPGWRKVMQNPMAYTAFKSTEPWLEEYCNLDMHGVMREVGFSATLQKACTNRHRTVVALKPAA